MALLELREKLLELLARKDERAIEELLGLEAITKVDGTSSSEAYADGLTTSEALFTSYCDYSTLFQDFTSRGFSSFCDIGGGIGRGKLLFDILSTHKSPKNYSVELLEQRHQEGLSAHARMNLPFPDGFKCCDLRVAPLPKADAYFIYLPVGAVLNEVLSKIEEQFQNSNGILYVIESHGDLIPFLKDSLPLKLLDQIPLTSKRHNPNIHVFAIGPLNAWSKQRNLLSTQNEEALRDSSGLDFFNYSPGDILHTLQQFEEQADIQLIIKEHDKEWLADLKGHRYGIKEGTIEIKTPYRIVELSRLRGLVIPTSEWQELVAQRRKPEKPLIRKIIISPTCAVEYSSGEIIELSIRWTREDFPRPLSVFK